ncbi:MAG: hypothetical protein IJA80_01550 [Clostridia bacterium]|nr:hypothetical protein [Clostridia bacterium]
MKISNRIVALILATIMAFSGCIVASAQEDVDYTINNPYGTVDFDSWGQYKADLHCHTTASDGDADMDEMIEEHYAQGYDALALTDHGIVSQNWTSVYSRNYYKIVSLISNKKPLTVTPLTEERYQEITTGVGRDGRPMIEIPMGIEQNPTSLNNAHVNSWYTEYGDGIVGGTSNYEEVIKNVDATGGLSVINHPGEYTSAKEEECTADAYDENDIWYSYVIKKFANILTTYDSCIGIDINSKQDGRTKYDRKLWDILLGKVVPTGRNVFAIATTDAHQLDKVGCAWTNLCMPENNAENIRTCLQNGAFFAVSRYIKNADEMAQFSLETGIDWGTEFEQDIRDESLPAPKVTDIVVDEANDTISLSVENALTVHWIADGKVIHVGNTIDLDEYSDEIGSYVRAEAFGHGGVLYTQAFTLEYDNAPEANDSFFFDFGNILAEIKYYIIEICTSIPIGKAVFDYLTAPVTK